MAQTGKWLKSVVDGYFNYHAVPGNFESSSVFRALHRAYPMVRTLISAALLFAALGVGAVLSRAAILPATYTMQNGESPFGPGISLPHYWDDTYNGTGDKTKDLASLSGGTGDLTDGLIDHVSTTNFNDPVWVGWQGIDPTITFNFTATTQFTSVTLHLANTKGSAGVSLPASIIITIGSQTQTVNLNEADYSTLASVAIPLNNVTSNSITIQLIRRTQWVFLDEVTFDGTVSPPVSRTVVVAFTGFGNAPSNGGFVYADDDASLRENSRGMTNLLLNIRYQAALSGVLSHAFTFYSSNGGSPTEGPSGDDHHAEAESWLRTLRLTSNDRLIIVGHSYGGHRARLFADHVIQKSLASKVDALVTVDPVDWNRCKIKSEILIRACDVLVLGCPLVLRPMCVQSTDTPHTRPQLVRTVRSYFQTHNPVLQGYRIDSAEWVEDLHVGHTDIDDRDVVQRDILNLMLPVPLVLSKLRPLVRLDRDKNGHVNLTLSVLNPNHILVTKVTVDEINLGSVLPIVIPSVDPIIDPNRASNTVLWDSCSGNSTFCFRYPSGSVVRLDVTGNFSGGSWGGSYYFPVP